MHRADQAKDLTCPLLKSGCKAENCAMWRWAASANFKVVNVIEPHPFEIGVAATVPRKVHTRSDYGYCGLAGRPEVFEQ